MKEVKHSVIVITYNQENLLPIALDSIFNQSIKPYEVIIGDDCSTDNTWSIVMQYYKKYPTIIKPIRHERNLGIFQNLNFLKKLPTGDVVSILAGDDWYEGEMFAEFNRVISNNSIDLENDTFILISNTIYYYSDGSQYIYNNIPFKDKKLFKVKIRYGLDFRDTGMSINLFRKINDIPLTYGCHADWLYTLDTIKKCKDFYFINKAFPVYRMGTGITSKDKNNALAQSRLLVLDAIKKIYVSDLELDDIAVLDYEKEFIKMQLYTTDANAIKVLRLFYTLRKDAYFSKDQNRARSKSLLIYLSIYILKKIYIYKPVRWLYHKCKKYENSSC